MAVKVAATPAQVLTFATLTVSGDTMVTVSELEFEHPSPSVAVSLYMVVVVGLTVGDNVVELVMLVVGVQAYDAT